MVSNNHLPGYIKVVTILVGVVIILYALYLGQNIIVPLIFALFASILVNPLVNFLVAKKVNRVLAITIALVLVMVVVGGLVAFIGVQANMFRDTYPQLKEKFVQTEGDCIQWVSKKFNIDAEAVHQQLSKTTSSFVGGMTDDFGHTLLTFGSFLVATVLIPVYIFLILYYKHLLLEFLRKLFPPTNHEAVVKILDSVNTVIRSYLMGLLIEGAIVAVLNSIGLLVLGIKYAILLGVTGAILNVIPYIGGITAIVLPMIIAFVTKSPISALWVLVVYSVIQFIDNHYLIPYIVASKVKLNALIAIVVVLIGDMVWGVPGMFLSIPLTALIKVTCDNIETLKPWGFLLGDNVPDTIRLPFKKYV